VFHGGESYAVRSIVQHRRAERDGFVRCGDRAVVMGGVRRGESIEKLRSEAARLAAFANLASVVGRPLIGTANDRHRRVVRGELRADLEADHDRDRKRQEPKDDLRRGDGVHEVVGASAGNGLR